MEVATILFTAVLISVVLMIVGFLIMIIGMITKETEHRVEGGGVIILGPIPIVFSSSQRVAKIILVLAIILTLMALALYLVSTGVIK
ncbi:MAG: DUF131 domain-containing protein [Sulfolobales archaeon]|nr:DUF131 domain-containing protein [Sulfolobales archaeon]